MHMKSHSSYRFSYIYHIASVWFLGILLHSIWIVMLLLHLKADKELNVLFVLCIFLQIIGILALLEFYIVLAALDDCTCCTCRKWSLQVLGLQGQQVHLSLHSPAQGLRDFPDVGNHPDPDTGLWQVRPDVTQGWWDVLVIHLNSFFRGTHLLPIFDGNWFLPCGFHHPYTLDSFCTYFVNKYIDHLAHKMLFWRLFSRKYSRWLCDHQPCQDLSQWIMVLES